MSNISSLAVFSRNICFVDGNCKIMNGQETNKNYSDNLGQWFVNNFSNFDGTIFFPIENHCWEMSSYQGIDSTRSTCEKVNYASQFDRSGSYTKFLRWNWKLHQLCILSSTIQWCYPKYWKSLFHFDSCLSISIIIKIINFIE